MGISYSTLMHFIYRFFSSILIIFITASCNNMQKPAQPAHLDNSTAPHRQTLLQKKIATLAAQEKELAIREQAISARETELVNLLAELMHQKKTLEISQASSVKKQTSPTRARTHKTRSNKTTKTKRDKAIILGALENVHLTPPDMIFSARVDTGAATSSLNAIDLVELERDGKPFVKFHVLNPTNGKKIELIQRVIGYVRIKEHKGKSQRRPIVKMRVALANIDEKIEFTLVDRSRFSQQVLLGRNFLRDLAIVDVSKKYTVPTKKLDQSKSK